MYGLKLILLLLIQTRIIAFQTKIAHNTIRNWKPMLMAKYNPFDYSDIKSRKYKTIRSIKKWYKIRKHAEERSLEFAIQNSRISQYVFYGYKMSRAPGDGGSIHRFRRGSDNRAIITSYYTGYYGKDFTQFPERIYSMNLIRKRGSSKDKCTDIYGLKNSSVGINRQQVEIINAYPDKTFGRFEGKEPAKSEMFAHKPDVLPHDNEYRYYATGKRPKVSKIPRPKFKISPRILKDQGYNGLLTDIIFRDIDKNELHFLRKMEVQLKSRTAEEKPPKEKTYWKRTYSWDVPTQISSMVESDESDVEDEFSFANIPQSVIDSQQFDEN